MARTPILDLEQAPPTRPRPWLPRLIGFAAGIAAGVLLALADPPFHGLLFIPCFYLAVTAHELGHLAAGKLAGLDTGGISVGGFVVLRSGRNWTFRFDRSLWAGGFVKPLTKGAGADPSRHVWFVAGGPGASVLLTAFAGWMWVSHPTSLFVLGLSVIPFSSGLNKSDGARLWQLWRQPERARSLIAGLALQTEEAKGVRPREWNPQTFEQFLEADASASDYA